MGWGHTFLLGDIGNRMDISDCEEDIRTLKESIMQMHQEGQEADCELHAIQMENNHLKLYVAAITRLLITKNLLSKEEIQRMVDIIDAEDGAIDQKNRGEII